MALKYRLKSDDLYHTGVERRSGRYPWGSGQNPEQRRRDFLYYDREFRNRGFKDTEIAEIFDWKLTQLRARRAIALSEKWAANAAQVYRMKETGMSTSAIGREMGVNESVIREYLDPANLVRRNSIKMQSDILKASLKDKRWIDVGSGVERHMGINRTKLDTAIYYLEEEGEYKTWWLKVEQAGVPGKYTSRMVLAGVNEDYKEIFKHRDEIHMPNYMAPKGSEIEAQKIPNPISLSRKRVYVRHNEEGGQLKDGLIELRRGVDDISLGPSRYAQVRIGVDGTHYMKGMAVYSSNIPKGYDIVYNSNKGPGSPKIFKPMETIAKDSPVINQEMPFGTITKPHFYTDKKGKVQQSFINIVNKEGDWEDWSVTLASQELSKQAPALAKRQLDKTHQIKQEQFDEIMSLTNPTVKEILLTEFADKCDSAAEHLKAAGIPRQSNKVLIPISSIRENEVYAPSYRDGERVVLIRHPHAGQFEIPELIVNNKNKEANDVMAQAVDAIGIHFKTAQKLSGADFDGDSVEVIPNDSKDFQTKPSLKGLKDFDPKEAYPEYPGMKAMDKKKQTPIEMGNISNLITDMTIRHASEDEMARAVRHSMVVIDAAKHKLNWQQSAKDNGISDLKLRYQGGKTHGASTLISRAKSQERVPDRKPAGYGKKAFDPKTGDKLYVETNATYTNKKGKVLPRMLVSTKMAEKKDAMDLSSGTRIEEVYGTYANQMKDLARKARLSTLDLQPIPKSIHAAEVYKKEVAELKASLHIAKLNAPLERDAQFLANKIVELRRQQNPQWDKDDIKKARGMALTDARIKVGARKQPVQISDKQWEAIQAGAITPSLLKSILLNTDTAKVKELSMPHKKETLSPARKDRALGMLRAGCTQAEVADALDLSVSSLYKILGVNDG